MAMVGLVFVFSGGGGGESGPWSVTDPQNDFVPTFADKDGITSPDGAGDVTGLDVAVADGNTTVTVTFAGAAEGLMTEGGQELAAGLQFIPVGDERVIDMLFREDGSVKISDPPSGSGITATWSSPNVLVFEITGVTPASGATVRFHTLQRAGFAHSTDEVSLATGGPDAVVAPVFVRDDSGGDDNASPPRAVLVDPCDVIDGALAASLVGSGTERVQSGSRDRLRCVFRAAADGGVELRMEVIRNNASASSLAQWRRDFPDVLEVRAVPWSGKGELRIGDAIQDLPRSLLWASVFERPEYDSDVFIIVQAFVFEPPSSISAAALTAGVETIAEMLNDALIGAQP
jgi:hypothetical protein